MLRSVVAAAAAAAALASVITASGAQAAEVSFVSGLYRTEKNKVAGEDAGKKSTIDVGGRFGDALDTHWHWFGQGLLTMRSYSGDNAPSDSTSLDIGGGLRYYFARFGESTVPFVYGVASYRNDEDSEPAANGFAEKKSSGLYYGAHAGVRLSLGTEFFLDLDTQLFESALFATEKTERTTVAANGDETTTKDETTRTELYVNSTGAFQTVQVALGYKF